MDIQYGLKELVSGQTLPDLPDETQQCKRTGPREQNLLSHTDMRKGELQESRGSRLSMLPDVGCDLSVLLIVRRVGLRFPLTAESGAELSWSHRKSISAHLCSTGRGEAGPGGVLRPFPRPAPRSAVLGPLGVVSKHVSSFLHSLYESQLR